MSNPTETNSSPEKKGLNSWFGCLEAIASFVYPPGYLTLAKKLFIGGSPE